VRLALALVFTFGLAAVGSAQSKDSKLDRTLNARADRGHGFSRVIVTLKPGHDGEAAEQVRELGGKPGRRLQLIHSQAAVVPNASLRRLARSSAVEAVHWDRPTSGANAVTAVTTGARSVQNSLGFKGRGVGVAVIDSGIAGWHDDLGYTGYDPRVRTVNGQRVVGFVDFVNGLATRYDDYGHGTHVAGIIAGNGSDSWGARAGIAPGAHLVALKVLDSKGAGVISNVIAALEYAVANKAAFNIRVINLSVGAPVTESYTTDPLALAAKRAVDAGIVVVAAAGNRGKNTNGQTQYGGITAPGNAPWVLTVGASSTEGTTWRWDDAVANYSSRGPSAIDYLAKPDVVAPGTSIVSLSDPAGTMYASLPSSLLVGSFPMSFKPYLALSGSSMAAPVVAGTVALMLEANPNLTPNLVKALIQYTAQSYNYNALTQGAGFLNSYGAVRLARYFATALPGEPYPTSALWGRAIIWGNHRLTGGVIKPRANAWATNVVWGASASCDPADPTCENIVWGTHCSATDPDCQNIVWGTNDSCDPSVDPTCENIVWGTGADGENIVWGTSAACDPNVDPSCENIVWGTTADDENIVWGTQCGEADCQNIVWGTSVDTCDPSIDPACQNIVWGTSADGENIVWGTSADTCDPSIDPTCQNIVWGTDNGGEVPLFEDPNAMPVNYDDTVFELLFDPSLTGGR
jgi:serine protease AprX